MLAARLGAKMDSLLLSCRTLSFPTTCRFIPAHSRNAHVLSGATVAKRYGCRLHSLSMNIRDGDIDIAEGIITQLSEDGGALRSLLIESFGIDDLL